MSVFFLDSLGMNRSPEQTNCPKTASRLTQFVCPALEFIPHEPRKKDTYTQIARKPLHGSGDLFVPHPDSFQMNTEKKDTHYL